jgi:ketosteroid isomerase-like protein
LTEKASANPNVAATRRFIEAYNEGDLDSLVALADPNIEWEVAPEHPAATTHRGIDAVREYHEDWRNTLHDLRIDLRSIAASGDTVVTVCGVRGEGAESGADVEVEIAFLTTFDDGKAVRVEEFLDPAEALRALGADAPSG